MSTLAAVTKELENLNGITSVEVQLAEQQNVRLDALSGKTDKTNELLSDILSVMRDFMMTVPQQITSGFLVSVEDMSKKTTSTMERGFEALADIAKLDALKEQRRKAAERESSEQDGNFVTNNFMKGYNDGVAEMGIFKGLKSALSEGLVVAGGLASGLTSVMGVIGSTLKGMWFVVRHPIKAITKAYKFLKFFMGASKIFFLEMISNLKSMTVQLVKNTKQGIVNWGKDIVSGLKLIGNGFKMLAVRSLAFIQGIGAAITSTLTAMAPALAALAPFIAIGALIAAGVTALVMGINSFIEDFNAQEGSVFDKILAGLLGFVDGFMKILTIPLDWIVNLTAKVLDFFGFDGAAKVLEEFSLTDMVDSMTDGILEFLLKIKDGIVGFASDAWNGIKSFFGFGDDEETNAPERLSDRERKTLETIRDAREDGIQRAVAQGYTQEEAEKMAESGKFDPAKTRRNSRKISTQEINERLQQDMLVDISQGVVEEKKYRYDITDPVTGELIDSAGTPEEAAQIAMQTGGKIENPVERTGTTPAITTGEVASTTPAINSITSDATVVGQSVLNDLSSDSSSVVSASNDRSVMNETMIQETTKLNDNRSEVGGAGGIVAPTVNANNNSTNVTSNTTNVHGIPSAVDKSDRTDRRGSFRGRG